MANKKYNGWIVGEAITQGGQGQIFPAKHPDYDENKQYVLKNLTNKKRIGRLKGEIKAGLKLEHPNILKVVDYEYETKHPFIVTEYQQQGNLLDLNLDKLTLEEKILIFRKITAAVAFAHQNMVIHRDLKPDNIFFKDELEPVIGDFGLCLFTDDDERVTSTNEAVGSRYYMAPELADGKIDEVEFSVDVYSLGKIFYWLLTGTIFDREKHREPNYDITQNNPKRELFLINELLDNMIVEHPENRFTDGETTLKELNLLSERIKMGANCIDPKVPQICIYCGIGNYENIEKSEYASIPVDVDTFFFNFSKECNWTIFQCNHCNNIQIFSPILEGSVDKWEK